MEQQVQLKQQTDQGADYSMLIKRLEKAVISNNDIEKNRALLKREDIWHKISPDQAVQWAGIAQIAGLTETALAVYKYLTYKNPEFKTAWKEYIELLDILDKREALAGVVKAAKKHLKHEVVESWIKHVSSLSVKPGTTSDTEPSAEPFIQMQTKQKLLKNFLSLFSGRQDVFARQWADKKEGKAGYVPVRRPIELTDIEDHIKGIRTYGFYLMDKNGAVKCGVIDADLLKEFRGSQKGKTAALIKKEKIYMISRIREESKNSGLNPVIEISGSKGFHFWYFIERKTSPASVRNALNCIKESVHPDLSCFDLEIFPKQDHLTGKGFGNLVKFPLGIHRLSGRRSFFPECSKKDTVSQLSWLDNIKKCQADLLETLPEKISSKNLIMHPRMKVLSKKYPGLPEIEHSCPPLGQIIALARERRSLSSRQEKILFQTLGFLPDARKLLHYILSHDSEYNPHMVDYKLSRIRGTPLGCRRIHSLTGFIQDYCDINPDTTGYIHPLIHVKTWTKVAEKKSVKCHKIENLTTAVENMKTAIIQLEKFI